MNWELLNQFLSKKIISRIGERGEEWLSLRKLEYEYKKTLKRVFEKPLPLDKNLGISLKEVYTDPKGVKDLISNQSLEPKGVSDLIWDRWEHNQNSFTLLLGQPGGGKSSLIKKLSYDWAENNREPYPKDVFERNLYTVQLRYLPEEFKDDPVKFLTNYLRGEYDPPHDPFLWDEEVIYLFKGYRNSILLLDGLDEFVMNYQLTEEETKNLLEKLADGLSRYNCKVLITSRPNYLSKEHLEDLNKRWGYTVWELQPFTLEEINEFLDKYKRALTEKHNYQKKVNPENPPKVYLENFDLLKERVEKNLNAEEPLANQPLLLYMFAHLYLREGKTPRIGGDIELYKELITATIRRRWEDDNHLKKVITSAEWDYLYRRFLEELAFLIEFSNKPYATLEEVEKLKVFETLKRKTKLSEKNLLGSLLTFFYLHRGSDKETQTVEFIHKTFQEYLAASNIYNQLLGNLHTDNKEYEDLIWDLFSKKQVSPKVREFLETIIKEHREKDREKQDQFLEKMKEVFPYLLEKDFVVKPHELVGEKPLNKPLWCFGNLWVFASKISELYLEELRNIPEKEKWKYNPLAIGINKYSDKFGKLIRLIQQLDTTYIRFLNLGYLNLQNVNLINTDLSWVYIKGSKLQNTLLTWANLRESVIENSELIETSLAGSYLRKIKLIEVLLQKIDFRGSNLRKAKIQDVTFQDVVLDWATLKGAKLNNVTISNSSLKGVNFTEAEFKRVDFINSNLENIVFYNTTFADVKFLNGIKLTSSDFRNAKFLRVSLEKADLSKAILTKTLFINVNLKNAILEEADLSWANFEKEVDLREANLRGANLTGVIFKDANLEGADLRGAIFDPEEIKKAKNWDKAIYDDEMKRKIGLE